MKRTLMARLLATLTLSACAAPALAASHCVLEKVAELPVTMAGPRAMISAKINGQDVRLFVDTGAFWSSLNPGEAARLGLKPGPLPPFFEVRGVTGDADMRLATAKEFSVIGLTLHNADFLINEHGDTGDGLLGENVLDKLDVEYDFANGVMRFFITKDCGDKVLAYWSQDNAIGEASIDAPDPNQRIPQGQIIANAKVNGSHIRVTLDTGAWRSTMTLAAARRAGVATDGPGVTPGGSASGAGRRVVSSWLAPFSSFEIGGEQVKSTRLRIADFDLGDSDMLLGADFFLSHRIFVSRAQHKIYFTYNGGVVFNLDTGPPTLRPPPATGIASAAAPAPTPTSSQASPDTPTDAEGFSRRAAAEAARHEYDQAIADETSAMAMAPRNPQYVFDRGATHLLAGQPALGLTDLNAALALKPDYKGALLLRGDIRLRRHDEAGAKEDFAAAMKLDPNASATIGNFYAGAGDYETAVTDLSQWIDGHPKNEDAAGPLASRCRARAMWNQQLDAALGDCNQALKYRPGDPVVMIARGLVELRLDRLDPAIADFTRAIGQAPKSPWALYGRGLAQIRKGHQADGDADLAAAAALNPRLPAEAAKLGFAPGGGPNAAPTAP